MKRCWHRWDVTKDVRNLGSLWVYGQIVNTTKTCRKCGEVRVKEQVKK